MNPLLDAFTAAEGLRDGGAEARSATIAKYGFAIPTEEALEQIGRVSPAGVVEVGAGTGYWAYLLSRRNVDVEAFDIEPAPSAANGWFAGTSPWHRVQRGDHSIVRRFPQRTLLIVWPTKNEVWASAAVEEYHDAGGDCVVFVGEVGGGRTGDDVFHARLGELGPCHQCTYGVPTSPCTCDIVELWSRQTTVVLPHWPGFDDNLYVYARSDRHRSRRKRSRRSVPSRRRSSW